MTSVAFGQGEIELQQHGAAERVQRELAAATRHLRVECRFEIARLDPHAPLVSTTVRNLLVAGALTRPIGRHFRVEWHWW